MFFNKGGMDLEIILGHLTFGSNTFSNPLTLPTPLPLQGSVLGFFFFKIKSPFFLVHFPFLLSLCLIVHSLQLRHFAFLLSFPLHFFAALCKPQKTTTTKHPKHQKKNKTKKKQQKTKTKQKTNVLMSQILRLDLEIDFFMEMSWSFSYSAMVVFTFGFMILALQKHREWLLDGTHD